MGFLLEKKSSLPLPGNGSYSRKFLLDFRPGGIVAQNSTVLDLWLQVAGVY